MPLDSNIKCHKSHRQECLMRCAATTLNAKEFTDIISDCDAQSFLPYRYKTRWRHAL